MSYFGHKSCCYLLPFINVTSLLFLDPRWKPQGFYKIGSVCLSLHLSKCFLGNMSLIFSKFSHGARIQCEVVLDRAEFSGEIFLVPKIGKIDPKWAKNRYSSIYWKIWSSIFAEFEL